jgi:hypothetical protein
MDTDKHGLLLRKGAKGAEFAIKQPKSTDTIHFLSPRPPCIGLRSLAQGCNYLPRPSIASRYARRLARLRGSGRIYLGLLPGDKSRGYKYAAPSGALSQAYYASYYKNVMSKNDFCHLTPSGTWQAFYRDKHGKYGDFIMGTAKVIVSHYRYFLAAKEDASRTQRAQKIRGKFGF